MKLYHYTCLDHGAPGIQWSGSIVPSLHPLLRARLLWLTDLDVPVREVLGLTSRLLTCDRTAVRYTVDAVAEPWSAWARQHRVPMRVRDDLERYGLPSHWWVAEQPVRPLERRITVGAS